MHLRLIAILPIVFTIITLVLSFLCLFAGTNNDLLGDYDMLTLNTSRIAVDVFNTTTLDDGGGGFLDHLIQTLGGDLANITNTVESNIETALNSALDSFAKTIGLFDFYSIHVLNYCQGYYDPSGSDHRKVVNCTAADGFAHFVPSATIQSQLDLGPVHLLLPDLNFPDQIDTALSAVRTSFNAIFVLYCLAIAATFVAFFGALAGLFKQDSLTIGLNIAITQIAFLSLLIASAILTAGTTQAVDMINDYGAQVSINAKRGNKLIGISWAAAVMALLAALPWIVDCVLGRRKRKITPKEMEMKQVQ